MEGQARQRGLTTKNLSSIYWFSSKLFNETPWKIGFHVKKKMLPELNFTGNSLNLNIFEWSKSVFNCITSVNSERAVAVG